MKGYVDLHAHSTASDGTDSPGELVAKAKKLGLDAIALTDHDTVGGIPEAMAAARELGMRVVPGCEVSTRAPLGSMHVLGLWLPENCAPLEEMLAHFRKKRLDRNTIMLEKLRGLGIDISEEELRAKASGTIGRPHMAALIVEKGFAKNTTEAFDKYLARNAPAYVPKDVPPSQEVTRLLHSLGATVILAHPLHPPCPMEGLEELVASLSSLGLDGLEVWHSRQSQEQSEYLACLAKKHNLGLSGGSDYHGSNKKDIFLGVGTGNLRVPASVLDALVARRAARGLAC